MNSVVDIPLFRTLLFAAVLIINGCGGEIQLEDNIPAQDLSVRVQCKNMLGVFSIQIGNPYTITCQKNGKFMWAGYDSLTCQKPIVENDLVPVCSGPEGPDNDVDPPEEFLTFNEHGMMLSSSCQTTFVLVYTSRYTKFPEYRIWHSSPAG